MTALMLAAVAVLAPIDWWSVASDRREIERWAKPAATLALVGVAAVVGDPSTGVRVWLVVAVALGLVGDVMLLGESESRFLGGLGAFALGHTGYVIAAVLVGVTWPAVLWAVPFLAVLLGWRFATETLPGAKRSGGAVLAGAVVFYAVVISAMVICATGTGAWVAAVGAMLFAVSDWVLGHNRFVRPWPPARLVIMVTYHTGQLLLILGLARA